MNSDITKAYNSDFRLLRFIHWLTSFSKRIFVNNRQNFPAIEWKKQIPSSRKGTQRRRNREEVRRLVDEFEGSGLQRWESCQSRDLALAKHLRSHLPDTRQRVIIDQIMRASIDGGRDAIGDCVLA